MQYGNKMNRYERREFQHVKLAQDLHGEGLYVFENRSDKADLQLPKPTISGKRFIGPLEQFQGDNYFMKMVARNELRLIRTITPPASKEEILKEVVLNESNKLILDQPDQITFGGKVEHTVASSKTVPKTSSSKHEETKSGKSESLLTEDPMSGIEIIMD